MKKIILITGLLGLLLLAGLYAKRRYFDPKQRIEKAKNEVASLETNNELRNGDLIFQTSLSRQSKAIQVSTKSKYSHCGLVFRKEDDTINWFVLEAVQPVKWTPLEKWIARGKDGKFVIKRLQTEPILPEPMLLKLRTTAEKYLDRNYDLTFEWSDDKIYCSELIWKVYKETTGIEVGKLQKLSDFDLTNEMVKKIMKERYGENVPMNETVISPQAIFESQNLKTIKEN
jgi:Permuted papain-like amidase enzyme, YaeF/YiiX, C92 family